MQATLLRARTTLALAGPKTQRHAFRVMTLRSQTGSPWLCRVILRCPGGTNVANVATRERLHLDPEYVSQEKSVAQCTAEGSKVDPPVPQTAPQKRHARYTRDNLYSFLHFSAGAQLAFSWRDLKPHVFTQTMKLRLLKVESSSFWFRCDSLSSS